LLRLFWIGGVLMVLSSLLVMMGDRHMLRESSLAMCVLSGYVMLVNADPGLEGTRIGGSVQILASQWSQGTSAPVFGMVLAVLGVGIGTVEFWYFSRPHPEQKRTVAPGRP